MGIVAPLSFIRGCPIVSLDFADNTCTLDFVLSTGSNVKRQYDQSTINPPLLPKRPLRTCRWWRVGCGMGTYFYFDGDSILLGDVSLAPTTTTTTTTTTSYSPPLRSKNMFAVAFAFGFGFGTSGSWTIGGTLFRHVRRVRGGYCCY